MRYYVNIRKIYTSVLEVNTTSPEEAIEIVKEGGGKEVELECISTIPDKAWTVNWNMGGCNYVLYNDSKKVSRYE